MAATLPSDDERRDRLRLTRSEGVGPTGFQRLIARFGSAAAALDALPELARRRGREMPRLCPVDEAEAELARHAALGATLLLWGDPAYPAALAAIDDPPPALTVLGDPMLLGRPSVAIVGARNASAAGRRLAATLARDLGALGYVVISGLARGIDAAAHAAALSSGTIGVAAGGADIVFPPEHAALHAEMVSRGAVLSENPPGTVPRAHYFPRRNRIVSGLSLGTVVVEAAARSGSLITARMALEQGREVFAVPGSPLDPRCHGTNDLIRQGAALTETADDVDAVLRPLVSLPPALRRAAPRPPAIPPGARGVGDRGGPDPGPDDDPGVAARGPAGAGPAGAAEESARAGILERLGPTPVTVDELARQCQLSASIVSGILLELELAGRLERHPGNRVSWFVDGP